MIGIVATIVGTGLALWVTSILYSGISFGKDTSVASVLVVAVIVGVVNAVIKPIIRMLSLPLNMMTFGLFGLVINAGLLLLVAWVSENIAKLTFTVGGFPPDFTIDTIVAAFVGAVVLSLVSTVIGFIPFLNPSK